MIKQVNIYSSVKPLVPDVFCILQKMPDSVLLEFLEKVLVTWFGIDIFDFPMGPCLNSLDTTRAQYWACNWFLVSVCCNNCPSLQLSVPTSEKNNRLLRTVGKNFVFSSRTFCVAMWQGGVLGALTGHLPPTLLLPPLVLSLLLPQTQSFSCMSERTEAFSARIRMPLRHKEMVDLTYLF